MPGCSSLSCKLQASEEIGKPAVTANKRQHIPSELASISASTCVESAPKRCVCLGNVDPSLPVAVYSTIPGPGSTLSLHRFCGTGLGGLAGGRVGMGGGGVGSPGRGHVPELSCQAAPTFPLDFPIPSASQAPDSQQNTPMLCFAACLTCLITYLISLMGLLLSEGDPCPVTPFLQIPCVFLSCGSAQLWLLPVPLPYALTATLLLLFCTQFVQAGH